VAPLAGGGRAGSLEPRLPARPIEPTPPQPRELAPELQERICACRRETGWGPRLVAAATGVARSTVWKVLKRAGIHEKQAQMELDLLFRVWQR